MLTLSVQRASRQLVRPGHWSHCGPAPLLVAFAFLSSSFR